jgi:hypothetical protein
MVSGRYFFPALPLLCVNLMPAAAVTSTNFTALRRQRGDEECCEFHLIVTLRGRGSSGVRCCLRAQHARLGGDGLRRLVGFEALEELLFTIGVGRVAHASIGEHQRVVSLHVFRVYCDDALERFDSLLVFALQEQNAADLVLYDSVARYFSATVLRDCRASSYSPSTFCTMALKKCVRPERVVDFQGAFDEGFCAVGLAFLYEGSGDVGPSVGVAGLGFGDAGEAVFSGLEVTLQEMADAPVVPSLAVLFPR